MDISIFLAKIFALMYLAVGLGFLINQAYYKKALTDISKDAGAMYLGGVFALIIGYLILQYHNIWEQSWVVLITIIGWLAIIKGAMLLVFPETMMKLSADMLKQKNMAVWTVIALILGLVFAYFGFFA